MVLGKIVVLGRKSFALKQFMRISGRYDVLVGFFKFCPCEYERFCFVCAPMKKSLLL
jgi:hypothetical protein